MSLASDTWNALSKSERHRLHGCIVERQILDLEIEKSRAITAHKKHMTAINNHMRNLRQSLQRWEDSQPDALLTERSKQETGE